LTSIVLGLTSLANGSPHAERIDHINTATQLWRAGPTRFHDPSTGVRMTDLLGASDNKAQLDEAIARGEVTMVHYNASLGAIPDDFDSETNWPACASIIGDIRDQSNCGCCWAFGPASAASDRYCIATGDASVTFSAEDVCFCANFNGCGGGFTGSAWNHIQKGVVTGGQQDNTGPIPDLCSAFSLPHCHHHGPQGSDPYPAEGAPGCPSQRSPSCPRACDANAVAPHNDFANDKYSFSGQVNSYSSVEAIQQAIMTGGPIATAFTVYADFEDYTSGIYHHVTGSSVGGHAVRFVGWGVENGVKYWKVANSWNPYWGEKGYFRIVRGTNEGGIEQQGIASADTATWTNPHA
jgi:cathepsin B